MNSLYKQYVYVEVGYPRILSGIYDGTSLQKWFAAKNRWLFSKKVPPLMSDRVLNKTHDADGSS